MQVSIYLISENDCLEASRYAHLEGGLLLVTGSKDTYMALNETTVCWRDASISVDLVDKPLWKSCVSTLLVKRCVLCLDSYLERCR